MEFNFEGCEVVVADVELLMEEQMFTRMLMSVSPERQQKARRYKFPKGKALSLGAALALDKLLQRRGLRERDQRYLEGKHGKPSFADHPEIHFSISHSSHFVACAMADCEKTDDYFLDIGFYLPIDTVFPEACIKKAQELAEAAKDANGLISSIYDFVCATVKYDKPKARTIQAGYMPTPDETMSNRLNHAFEAASRDWNAEINWDSDEIPWIAVTPDHGEASDTPQRVVVTVLNNAGYNRNKQVKFSINYDYKTIAFAQTGERGEEIIGTLDNPLTVAGAVKYVKSLGADVQSSSGVYVKGKISRIDDNNNFASSGTYGNATFYISDDGTENGDQFYCYRVLYLGNKKWNSKTDTDVKVGDDVIIYGYVVNYKGNTPETVQGTAFVYEHNGVNRGTDEGGGGGTEGTPAGTGTVDDPYNVAAARAAVKNLTWTSNDNYEKTGTVYVKGKISRIADNGTYGQSGTFGNATFYINDDGADGAELYCYRILYLGNKKYTSGTDIKVGDEVIICGELMNYRGNTPETVANAAYLYSLNGEGGETPPGPGPAATRLRARAAIPPAPARWPTRTTWRPPAMRSRTSLGPATPNTTRRAPCM